MKDDKLIKNLKVGDVLPYFYCDNEIIQVCTETFDSYDEFHADSKLLLTFHNWIITDMAAINEDVIRIMIRETILE